MYEYQNRPRRQDIEQADRRYRENGSIYMTKIELFRKHKNRLCGKIAMHLMQECESWEIDTDVDFVIIEELMRRCGL